MVIVSALRLLIVVTDRTVMAQGRVRDRTPAGHEQPSDRDVDTPTGPDRGAGPRRAGV